MVLPDIRNQLAAILASDLHIDEGIFDILVAEYVGDNVDRDLVQGEHDAHGMAEASTGGLGAGDPGGLHGLLDIFLAGTIGEAPEGLFTGSLAFACFGRILALEIGEIGAGKLDGAVTIAFFDFLFEGAQDDLALIEEQAVGGDLQGFAEAAPGIIEHEAVIFGVGLHILDGMLEGLAFFFIEVATLAGFGIDQLGNLHSSKIFVFRLHNTNNFEKYQVPKGHLSRKKGEGRGIAVRLL